MKLLETNIRIQNKYLQYQKEAKGKSDKTIKHSLYCFDVFFNNDYKNFNNEDVKKA